MNSIVWTSRVLIKREIYANVIVKDSVLNSIDNTLGLLSTLTLRKGRFVTHNTNSKYNLTQRVNYFVNGYAATKNK